jgi:hypothetical protein
MVLVNGNGEVVGRSEGLGTNHWVGVKGPTLEHIEPAVD